MHKNTKYQENRKIWVKVTELKAKKSYLLERAMGKNGVLH